MTQANEQVALKDQSQVACGIPRKRFRGLGFMQAEFRPGGFSRFGASVWGFGEYGFGGPRGLGAQQRTSHALAWPDDGSCHMSRYTCRSTTPSLRPISDAIHVVAGGGRFGLAALKFDRDSTSPTDVENWAPGVYLETAWDKTDMAECRL